MSLAWRISHRRTAAELAAGLTPLLTLLEDPMGAARWSLARRTPGLVAVLCLTLATAGAAPVRTGPSTGRIAGYVRDGRGAPVVHAQVQVVGTALSALSDTAGGKSNVDTLDASPAPRARSRP